MELLSRKHKREGLVGTIVFHLALLLIFIFAGLKYPDPRPEQGVVVDFGTSDAGTGQTQPTEVGAADNVVPDPAPDQNTPTETSPSESVDEDVLTDTDETVELPETQEQTTEKPEEDEDPEENPEETQEKEEERQISEQLSGALEKFKKSDKSGGSDGDDDDEVGDKGDPDGSRSNNYSGGTGGKGNGNYDLGSRSATQRPIPEGCGNEEGTVVIEVQVDRDGNTIRAQQGRGTTASDNCLIEAAKQAALNTKWSPDPNAPRTQQGKITYKFILGGR